MKYYLLAFFFFKFIPRNIYFPAALYSWVTKPPNWDPKEVALTRCASRSFSTSTFFPDCFFPSRSEEFANVVK